MDGSYKSRWSYKKNHCINNYNYKKNNLQYKKKGDCIMSIRYIYDSKGKKTDVVIPIEIWNKSKSKILKEYEKREEEKVFKPSKYRGIYHHLKLDLEKETKKLRDEWVRI